MTSAAHSIILRPIDPTLRQTWARTIGAAGTAPTESYKPTRAAGGIDVRAGFDVAGELARGGMGVVYRAVQSSLDREVALKTPQGDEPEFISEARVTGFLAHPNIVPVHDLGRAPDGALFLAMKLVGGAPWKPAGRDDNLEILLAVCNAVAFAHSRGIAHCDLKPANVMVGEFGEVLVMDWGLAVGFVDGARAPRNADQIDPAGTPAYMAPEQARGDGEALGPATDTYLLGAILHEILAGRPPHRGETIYEVLEAAIRSEPPELPGELGAICARAMSSERYGSVAEFQGALRGYLRHRESHAIAEAAERSLAGREYADAIAGFRQARVLWDGNAVAREGERRAREAYAESALAAGDLGLAEQQAQSEELRARVGAAKAERSRAARTARRTRRALAAAAMLLVIGGSAGTVAVTRQRDAAAAAESRADEERAAALSMMRTTAKIATDSALHLRRQGLNAHMRESLPALKEAYAGALERAPKDAEVEYLMGRMHRALMEDDLALHFQERALAKDPNHAGALYEHALLLSGRYRDRLSALKQIAMSEEGERLAAGGGGEVRTFSRVEAEELDATLRGLRDAVVADIERLRGARSDCAEGILLSHRGEFAAAERLLERAVEENPRLEEGFAALAETALYARAYDRALAWSRAGERSDRGYLPHLMNAAEAQSSTGDALRGGRDDPGPFYEAAIADYDRALALAPDRVQTLVARGHVRINWGVETDRRGADPTDLYRAAIEDFDRALDVDPDSAEAAMGRGAARTNWAVSLRQRGGDSEPLLKAAIDDYDRALRIRPDFAEAFIRRAATHINRGNHKRHRGDDPGECYQAAIDDLDRALRLDPSDAFARIRRADARVNWAVFRELRGEPRTEWFRTSIDDYTQVLSRDPSNAEALTRRADAHANWGYYGMRYGEDPVERFAAADVDYDAALALRPDDAEVLWRRAGVRHNWSRYEIERGHDPEPRMLAAIADLDRAIDVNPKLTAAWIRRASLRSDRGLYRAGRGEDPSALYRAAIDDCTRAFELNPAAADALMVRGDARVNWGNFELARGNDPGELYAAAIADFDAASGLDPASDELPMRRASARANWAAHRMRTGGDPADLHRAAIDDFDKALTLNPGSVEALLGRAGVRINWGVYDENHGSDPGDRYRAAIEDLDRAIELNPLSSEAPLQRAQARLNWAVYLGDRGDEVLRAAIADCDLALKLNPALAEAMWRRGMCRWLRSEWSAACADFEAAARMNPSEIPRFEAQWKDARARNDPDY